MTYACWLYREKFQFLDLLINKKFIVFRFVENKSPRLKMWLKYTWIKYSMSNSQINYCISHCVRHKDTMCIKGKRKDRISSHSIFSSYKTIKYSLFFEETCKDIYGYMVTRQYCVRNLIRYNRTKFYRGFRNQFSPLEIMIFLFCIVIW